VFADIISYDSLIMSSLPTTAGLYHLDSPSGPCEARILFCYILTDFLLQLLLFLFVLEFYGSECVLYFGLGDC
jgi:hypothetical protein